MIPATQTLKDAIASPSRKPVLQITLTLGGTDYEFTSIPDQSLNMITGYSLQRTPQDQVIRASQISGTIAAQCNFTLQGWQATVDGGFLSSDDLSIYKAGFDALRDNDYGIDAKVAVRQGFVTTAGVETVQVFVGFVDKIDVSDDGAISFLCLDGAGRMQGEATLPAAAPGPTAVEQVVELLLRAGGHYRTPPPIGNCVLSLPSNLPEIGSHAIGAHRTVARDGKSWSYAPTWSVPTVAFYFEPKYRMTKTLNPVPGDVVIIEGRFKNPRMGIRLYSDPYNPYADTLIHMNDSGLV